MSPERSTASVRFCPGCGESAGEGARYCTACGGELHAGGVVSTALGARLPIPGLIVLSGFLSVGLGLWFLVLQPENDTRKPLAPKASPVAQEVAPAGALPEDHPPLELPQEVRDFIADLERKAEAAPEDLPAWKNLAQVLYRAGQVDRQYLGRAEAAYQHVLGIDSRDADALRGLGNVHFDREEHEEAIGSYLAYLEVYPDDANVRTDLGTMYLYAGQPQKAIEEYQRVIAKDAKFYQAYFNLGIAWVRQGDPAQAVAAFEKARDLAPDEEGRRQIQAMIDRSSGAPAAGGFRERVERSVRSHPIAGPKVAAIEWTGDTEGRVLFDEFPMEAMPEFARKKFLERLETDLEAARGATDRGPATLALVDRATGSVMATVSAPPKP